MFDFAWSEIALIGIVALIAIGPKDLPVAMKAISQAIKKARRMAGEFQTHVDEMVREADLGGVRDQFNEIRRMDIKNTILKAVDDDGSLRSSLSEPLTDFSPPPPPVPVHDEAATVPALSETEIAAHAEHTIAAPEAEEPAAPAFVPPGYAPTQQRRPPAPPAFVPPAAAAAEHA